VGVFGLGGGGEEESEREFYIFEKRERKRETVKETHRVVSRDT